MLLCLWRLREGGVVQSVDCPPFQLVCHILWAHARSYKHKAASRENNCNLLKIKGIKTHPALSSLCFVGTPGGQHGADCWLVSEFSGG